MSTRTQVGTSIRDEPEGDPTGQRVACVTCGVVGHAWFVEEGKG